MSPIETRLADRQATLAGITRAIHQHLGQTPLARVELRYSTQARVPLAPQVAKQTIANLLREHGHGITAVSVRAHEGPIDDATGEHLLRLFPAEPARAVPSPQPAGAAQPLRGWRAWLARWFPRWFSAPAPAPRQEPGLARPQPAVASAEAVAKLRQAVRKGATLVVTDTGTAVVGGSSAAQAVNRARIIVRLEGLHRVLQPLVQKDAASIAGMVKAAGLVVATDFAVDYRFEPAQVGDGTSVANESDVEVWVIVGASAGATVLPASQASAQPQPASAARPQASTAVAAEGTALAGGTAMPAPSSVPGPALTVRVLGTLQASFAEAFELHFDSLPARFDRAALERAGFGRAQPGLLAVASNSCPLLIRQGDDGELRLQAATRTVADGADLPMYFQRDTLQGLHGELSLPGGRTQLIVNAPGGVHDPASGRLLPALVIELLPAWGATRQGRLPLAA